MGAGQSAFAKSIKKALDNDESLCAFPSEPFYQEDHVKRYNLDYRTTPVAVTYPKNVRQIQNIVKVAVKNNIKVQPKGGGHSFANYSSPDGGIIVDLRNFQHFSMDTKTWQCTVGAGTLLGDLTKRMYDPHRRAMAHGTCPQVGIGGHATIGGLGPSSRLWGAALDHILEVEVVLADASVVRASQTQNTDLFWALRGAGASFGIITEFVVRTEPAPGEAVQYSFSFTSGTWRDLAITFKAWQAFVSDPKLTWKFASTVTITQLGLVISGTYYGSREEYDALDCSSKFPGNQHVKTIVFKDWLGLLAQWAEDVALQLGGGLAAHTYTKTLTFNHCYDIPEAVTDSMFKFIEDTDKGAAIWFIIFDLAGGQINQYDREWSSYAHRDALFYLQAYAISAKLWSNVSETTKDFLKGFTNTIKAGIAAHDKATGKEVRSLGAYPGYVDPDLPNAQQQYWRDNLPRLEMIKGKVDPKDVFHNWQSVRPKK